MRQLIRTFALAGSLLVGVAAPGIAAQDPPPSATAGPGKYMMTPVDGGFLRMDTDTGDVSICTKKAGSFACEAVKDEALAKERALARLEQENKDMKRELGERRANGPRADRGPDTDRAERKLELPTEEEVDKALSYLDRMMKKFKGFMDKQKDGDGPGKIAG